MNSFVDHTRLEPRENVIAGIVGAFLFSLAGAAVYFLLYMIGYIASISGIVGAVCAVKGYSLFAKKESKKGIVIATVMAFLTIVLAWYFGLAYDIYDAYKIAFKEGVVDFTLSVPESIRAIPVFLEDPEFAVPSYKDLALSLVFCLIGCGSYVFTKIKNAGKAAPTAAAPQAEEQAPDNTEE